MRGFIHDDVWLNSRTARHLYHDHAAKLPIVDFHSHLDAADLAADRVFDNLALPWVAADPYKHRAMRIAGVSESQITGPVSDRERFDRWAATVPVTLGNPLFAWTALELKRYFDIDETLDPDSADRIWTATAERLRSPTHSARGLLVQRRVECACTSDRLLDDLAPHVRLAEAGDGPRVLPSLRADDATAAGDPGFPAWAAALGTAAGVRVDGLDAFRHAVGRRLDHFAGAGARLVDHALDDFTFAPADDAAVDALLRKRLAGDPLATADLTRLRSGLLSFLGAECGRRDWTLQLHIGAQRRTSSRLRAAAGPAGGYAAIGRPCDIPSLCAFLDALERAEALPRTILYPLHPADMEALAVLTGSFTGGSVPGRVQLGPAWWYNDHADGIRRQLAAATDYGLLSAFIGMTTDSRSLFSMCRHEYFRRILCDFVGGRAEAGELPMDESLLGALVRAIAWENPRRWVLGGKEGMS